MNVAKFVGRMKTDIRYDVMDGELWFAIIDIARCTGYSSSNLYNMSYSFDVKQIGDEKTHKWVSAICEKNIRKVIGKARQASPDFLPWFKEFCDEHRPEPTEAPMPITPVRNNVISMPPPVAHTAPEQGYVTEDILIEAYFTNPLPEVKEMTRQFLVAAKKMNNAARGLEQGVN